MIEDELVEKVARGIAYQYELDDGFSEASALLVRDDTDQQGMWSNFKKQARAALAIARPIIEREALEEAAKMVVESYDGACYEGISRFIAADIRALMEQSK